MIEFAEYNANPLAPTILVDRIIGIYRVSASLVAVKYGFTSTIQGGLRQCVERINLVWEPARVLDAKTAFDWAISEWQNGTFHNSLPDDGGGRKPRTQ